MTTSVKNMGKSLVNTNNTNNYDNSINLTQFKSISQGNDFNTYLRSLKNKAIEGFDGRRSLMDTSKSVLLDTQISTTQQAELTRLKSEYALNQTSYNSLINTISSGTTNLEQMKQLETKLDSLSQQINNLNDIITENIVNVNDQINTNSIEREKYMIDIASTNTGEADMATVSNNIQNMLNDSDIRTLQTNYSYILFSIFAAASIIVAINVVRKN